MAQQKWDATQLAVLDAAVACAEQVGFGAMTTRRVAELAGVNEVTIFRRFGSKAGLVAAAFEREAATIASSVGDYTGDLRADLLRMVASIWDATGRRKNVLPAILSELANNDELRSAATYSIAEVGRVAGILARYQNEGALIEEPPLQAYASLVGPLVYLGIISRLLPEPPTVDLEAHVSHYLQGRAQKEPR
ncbi:helix-turn-helix domain containing protein [Mycolicibacterium sp. BiH015]|uniref:TetR/AcrR family transcriptional regulator n=1 Tax=Mycolicibacterium sp. BiH015 TaxID=3018808 RepID=UPI0022E26E2D|nr:TetR/AcrR family transcriptional regulator [Mycolicibacterium sp. BiH015]MDA2893212.1 helix-turn-helix domain containing protein [Mycolicibacterium sp. BiH015]